MAIKAPPGYVFVKNPKTGKYKLVKKGAANAAAAAKKKLTPAQKWANSVIAGQLAPLNEEAAVERKRYDNLSAVSGAVTDSLRQQIGDLEAGSRSITDGTLARVASRATSNAEAAERNNAFLESIFGQGGQAIDRGSDVVNSAAAEDAGLATSIQLGAQSSQRDANLLSGIAGLRNQQVIADAGARRDQNLAEIKRKGTEIRGTLPQLLRQYQLEERDYGLKADALGLDAAQLAEQQRQFDETLSAQEAAQAAEDAKKPTPQQQRRRKARAAIDGLNGALSQANAALKSPDTAAQATSFMRQLGLRDGPDYKVKGKTIKFTPTGLVRYFRDVKGLGADNYVYHAIKLYDPRWVGSKGFQLIKGNDGKMHLYHPDLVRWG